MIWYISKLIDSTEEFHERTKFYSELTRRELFIIDNSDDFFILYDGRNDNRCMIIGHTDTALDLIKLLKEKSQKRYKLYLCVCKMSDVYFHEIRKLTTPYELYLSRQEDVRIGTKLYLGCSFLDKTVTGFDFKATRSELNMFNLKLKGFFNKLDKSFTLQE